jgi:hypothetical protein
VHHPWLVITDLAPSGQLTSQVTSCRAASDASLMTAASSSRESRPPSVRTSFIISYYREYNY